MVPHGLEKVKGGSGPIHHGQVHSDSARVRRAHPPEFTVECRLQVPAFTPQQGRNVPGKTQNGPLQFNLI